MASGRIKARFLKVLSRTLNPVARRLARWGHGPFSVVRHVGRRTGTVYETPVMLARFADGFVAELTYGPEVQWYRNIVAAGGCAIVSGGREYQVDRIENCSTADGLRLFGYPRRLVLQVLRRHEFRLLYIAREDIATG